MITPQQFDPNVGTPGYDTTGALTTAAMSQALAAAEAASGNHAIYCPAGVYPTLYPGSGAEFFLSRKTGLIGDGGSTQFFIHGAPAGVDWFHVQPSSPAGAWTGLDIGNFLLANGDESLVRYGVNLDGTLGGTMQQITVDRFRSQANVSRSALALLGTSQYQAPAGCVIKNCLLYNAPHASILIEYGGDGIHIHDNILHGAQYGILAWLIEGAGNLVIDGANTITGSTAICIDGGTNITIADAQVESFLPDSPTNSTVSLRGAVSKIDTATIRGVQAAQTQAHPPNGTIVTVHKCDHATVQGRFGNYRGGSVVGVYVTAQATNTVILPSKFEFCSPKVHDASGAARYVASASAKPGWALP